MYYITFIHRIKRYHKTKRKKRQYTTDNVNLTERNKTTQHQTPKQLHKPWHNLHEHLYYVQSDINPFNARCPKLLPFEGFSAILV